MGDAECLNMPSNLAAAFPAKAGIQCFIDGFGLWLWSPAFPGDAAHNAATPCYSRGDSRITRSACASTAPRLNSSGA